MKIHSILITCLIVLMSQQILDYTDGEKEWVCKGDQQSPINLPSDLSYYVDGRKKLRILSASYPLINDKKLDVRFSRSYGVKFEEPIGTLKAIFNNEKTVKFHLVEVNFHLGSEHTFGDYRYDLEIQFVHAKNITWLQEQNIQDPDPEHSFLVVAVPFNVNPKTWDNQLLNSWNIFDSSTFENLDINPFINIYSDYYHYEGGFTTPNCDETVNWIVMRNPQIIAYRQIYALRNWVKQLYPDGRIYRKIQPLNERKLYYINRSGRRNIIPY